MQLKGVNSPIHRFMVSQSVNSDTHPETVRLLPISQSNMQTVFGFVLFKYYAKVDFPLFFFPIINKELFVFSIFSSMPEKGALVYEKVISFLEISKHS
jgi:hypothetical protein